MVMGDLVLTQDEVNPVMKSLAEGGIEITALHNHLLRSSPATMYMHVEGHGDPVKLATTLHTALALSGTPFATPNRVGLAPDHRPRYRQIGRGHRPERQGQRRCLPIYRAARRGDQRRRHGRAALDGHRHRDQLPAHGGRQGGDHRRFRARSRARSIRCCWPCASTGSR